MSFQNASDYQYYPTGAHLAARMWGKFKRPIGHVCDPSAGKGHLIRHAREGFPGVPDEGLPWLEGVEDRKIGRWGENLKDVMRKRFEHPPEVSCIEIDLQHHDSLRDLGVKILGYDFMEVQSLATVTQLLMNPPFQHGAAHVLRAWELVYDAEIVAVINAETIRNPFSKERQRLVQLIEQHGSVEFLEDQFTDDVDRQADVEVALIYLEKTPENFLNMESILGNLAKDEAEPEGVDVNVEAALALPTNFIQDTCYRFRRAVKAARAACEANALANAFTESLGVTLSEMQTKGVDNTFRKQAGEVRAAATEAFKERHADLKKRAWAQIIRSSLVNDKLSNQARRQVEASAASIYDLEFSEHNIRGFLQGVVQSLPSIYEQMILDLFDSIMERSSDNVVFYKSWVSNRKHKIGMRIRRSRFIMPGFSLSYGGSLNYESERFLADVDKVWSYLMGEPEGADGLVPTLRRADLRSSDRMSSRYFDARLYKGAGTLHLYPKSDEVVEKINRFVGRLRQWLPADMEEANADFKKQYDNGEAMTKAYMERYSKGVRSYYGMDRPAYALLRSLKGNPLDENERQLDRLTTAIEEEHKELGLQCGPALTRASNVVAIGMAPKAAPEQTSIQEPEQLSLLCA